MIHLLANGPGNVVATIYATDTKYFDANFVSRAPYVSSTDGPIFVNLPREVSADSENGIWLGFRIYCNYNNRDYDAANRFVAVQDANGENAFGTTFGGVNSGQYTRCWNSEGGGLSSSGYGAIFPGEGGSSKFDFHYYASEGNVYCDLYINQVFIRGAGPLAGSPRGIKSITFTGLGNSYLYRTAISEIVVADEDTRNIRVSDKNSLSAGTHSDWAGTVDSLSSANVGDVSTFAYANGAQPPLTGVRAIAVNAQMAADGGNIQAVLRKGGVDYKSESLNADATAKGLGHVWNSDPSGGSFGRLDDLAALEFGVEHIA